jgi:hypothetical protein
MIADCDEPDIPRNAAEMVRKAANSLDDPPSERGAGGLTSVKEKRQCAKRVLLKISPAAGLLRSAAGAALASGLSGRVSLAEACAADTLRGDTIEANQYLFNTHHHGDHVYGNRAVVDRTGATVIAHVGMMEELRRNETSAFGGAPGRSEQVSKLRPDVAATPVMAPTQMLERSAERHERTSGRAAPSWSWAYAWRRGGLAAEGAHSLHWRSGDEWSL